MVPNRPLIEHQLDANVERRITSYPLHIRWVTATRMPLQRICQWLLGRRTVVQQH